MWFVHGSVPSDIRRPCGPCSLTMSLPGLLRAGRDRGVPLTVRDPLLAFGPAITRWNRSHRGRPEGGLTPSG